MRFLLAALLMLSVTFSAQARDTEYHLKIGDLLQSAEYKDKVGSDVAFYFGSQPTPAVAQSFGAFVTNRKTNSVGRPDEQACRWAMLSALVELRSRALKLGGNAVVGIESYYRKRGVPSESEYVCHAGAIIAGVALRGTVVKLR
ncbi:MAG TPA: excinuclease ABC subunit A [Stellaceae bacterium]|nr:excinuclease ABC subunit A [Stellaceae bacterium]